MMELPLLYTGGDGSGKTCGIAQYRADCGGEILHFNKERPQRPLREFFALDGCGSGTGPFPF